MSEPEMRGDCGCAGTKHRPTCHVECQRAIALLEAEVERLLLRPIAVFQPDSGTAIAYTSDRALMDECVTLRRELGKAEATIARVEAVVAAVCLCDLELFQGDPCWRCRIRAALKPPATPPEEK